MNSKLNLVSFLMFFMIFFVGFESGFAQKNQSEPVKDLIPINEDYGKSNSNDKNVSEIASLFNQIEGTYQIQILKKDYKVLFSKSLYQIINDNRLETKDVFVNLDENSILFIPSLQKINDSRFKKLPQTIFIKK